MSCELVVVVVLSVGPNSIWIGFISSVWSYYLVTSTSSHTSAIRTLARIIIKRKKNRAWTQVKGLVLGLKAKRLRNSDWNKIPKALQLQLTEIQFGCEIARYTYSYVVRVYWNLQTYNFIAALEAWVEHCILIINL